MINWKKTAALLAASVMLLSGCTQSNIVSPEGGTVSGDGQPNFEVNKDTAIVWDEVQADLEDEFIDPFGAYGDVVVDLAVSYDEQEHLLTLQLPVTHAATPEIAVSYGQAVLKAVGVCTATQNFYYEAPDTEDADSTYYGSFFDENDVRVEVFTLKSDTETDTYLVDDTMKAGEQRALTALAQ